MEREGYNYGKSDKDLRVSRRGKATPAFLVFHLLHAEG